MKKPNSFKAPAATISTLLCAMALVSCRPTTISGPETTRSIRESADPIAEAPVPDPPPGSLVWIDSGTFTMGSPALEQDRSSNEGPQTIVTISRGFWIGRYEVTQGEYVAMMGERSFYFNGDPYRPADNIDWVEAVEYCARLTESERKSGRLPAGHAYRLPTSAEWEYACRAGTTTRFSYGDDPDYSQLGQYSWYLDNAEETRRVGMKLPNPWGLYDMHGNVMEWCSDWCPEQLPGGFVRDPKGPEGGWIHVYRGGGWGHNEPRAHRSAYYLYLPDGRDCLHGFRVVLAQEGWP
jgi:formylglycine-generating enzyme required for sulfatase activity